MHALSLPRRAYFRELRQRRALLALLGQGLLYLNWCWQRQRWREYWQMLVFAPYCCYLPP